jgi:FdhD protein
MLGVAGEIAQVEVLRVRNGRSAGAVDCVAVEAPLELRIAGTAFATIMRTPGRDRELVAGFLFAERVLRHPDDLGAIAHCTDPDGSQAENVINVLLTGESAAAARQALTGRRAVVASSACGVCGRRSIEDLAADCAPVPPLPLLDPEVIVRLPRVLRDAQAVFEQTGGLHAAGLFRADGSVLDVREDVGRHNAVDKVIGRLILRDEWPSRGAVLCVSGRTSFEIVQKAWVAALPCVVSVSAPSSLAIEVAAAAGITLIGFVRDDSYNVYTGAPVVAAPVRHG